MAQAVESSVEKKLSSLFTLQRIDSHIDKIRSVRGELPMEVNDLEDEIAGLQTRKENINNEIQEIEERIQQYKTRQKDAQKLIKKYEEQQMKVKNNREYEAINKEIELEGLEIQAAEKKIKQATFEKEEKSKLLEKLDLDIEGRNQDLKNKNAELKNITEETQIEEEKLMKVRNKASEAIEDRYVIAYNRIRKNFKNGIAVAKIERNACSGCFANIPPQRQLDIRMRKKITVCENCGRILIDAILADEINENKIG